VKNIISATAAALSFSFALATAAMATPVGTTGPVQTYDGDFGSGHIATVEAYLNSEIGPGVVYLGRLDTSGWDATGADAILHGTGAMLAGTDLSKKLGTWTFTQGTTTYQVAAIEINGGSHGALYLVAPWALSGYWDTNDLTAGKSSNSPGLSHLDFYAVAVPKRAVPEPATLSLVGAGFLGAGYLRRKRKA
jgi:hypothetical protein